MLTHLADYAASWTPYHFVHNSPLRFIDPSGMFAEESGDPPGGKKKEEDPLVQGFINYGKNILSFGRSLFSNPGGTLGGIGQGVAQGLSNFVNLDGGNLANTISRTGSEALEGYVNRVAGSSDPAYESQAVLGELAAEVTVGALLTRGTTGLASKGAAEAVVEGGVSKVAAKTSANAFKHSFKYADRVRMRAVQDPVSHNFPYSFDDAILSTSPILKNNGYKIFQQSGTMNSKNGVFEIGLIKDGIIDHRFFRPVK